MSFSPIACAAFHEAGHAVANLHYGIGIQRVWVRPNGAGMVERYWPSGVPYIELVSAWAGPYAEQRLTGDPLYLASDRDIIEANAGELAFPQVLEASKEARDLVRDRWASIVNIAAALVVERRLSGATVARLAEDTEDWRS